MTGRLAGKAAVVVGAGQQPGETIGNGRAIALTFAREGAEVLCVDRDESRAEAVVREVGEAGGVAHALAADAVTEGEAIVAAALDRFGRIDALVYNVGIGHAGDGPAHVCSDEAFETVFAVNFTGAVARSARRWRRCARPGAARSSRSARWPRPPAPT